jgi:DNA mismatch repair protein PMS2
MPEPLASVGRHSPKHVIHWPRGLTAYASQDVRFKNQGLDSIEIQDNGYGISPQNYETLALKHYTSKLSTYADLTSLQTFGFRGEALSSLCALSQFSVVTCTQEEAPKAKKLEFEASGKLKSTTVVSGHKGTTVIVENLFYNLPVRRRELERKVKREWGKVINLLNQYACVQTGVKFSVSQQPTKGKRMLLFSTKGNPTTRDNIINVFGVKSMAALITLDLTLELVPTHNPLHKRKADDDDGTREIRVKGHVSRPTHGEGRQTPDRQMFYVNGRPCGLPQFAKVFNEVYRSYNSSQSPFIFADIQLDTHLYDVNVSPDKRTILLHDQGQMLDNLRESLVELFEKQDVTVPSSQLLTGKQTPFKKPSVIRRDTPGSERSESTRASPFQQQSSAPGNHEEEPEPADEDEDDNDNGSSDDDSGNVRLSVTNRNARRASSKKSSAADTGAQNLMSRWVERKTDGQEPTKTRYPATVFQAGRQTTPVQQSILSAFRRDHHPPQISPEDEVASSQEEPEETSPLPDGAKVTSGQQATADRADRLVQDARSEANEASGDDQDGERRESPIPAIAPLSQPRPTLPPSTKSPRRPEQQVATIRIGDQTVTGVIGAPPKRPRTDSAPTSPARKRVAKPSVPLPSFGGRLTQLFAASGASQRQSIEDGDAEDASDDDPERDESEEEVPKENSDDQEDSLFVSQDEEGSPSAADEDQEPELNILEPDEEVESGPEGEEQDHPATTRDEEPENDRVSEVGSDMPTQNDPDGDYVDLDDEVAQGSPNPEVPEIGPVEPSEDSLKRQQMLLKGGAKRKDSTIQYLQTLRTNESSVRQQLNSWQSSLSAFSARTDIPSDSSAGLDADDAEAKLSLKISKSDFSKMKIVGQFNLGFIIAVREAEPSSSEGGEERHRDDEVFIIDQHASDEKFNFERLQSTTVVQSQRLVQPKTLDLTAMEEEVIMENIPALETNGFQVRIDDDSPVGSRVQLLSLPLSRETTFGLADLEELIFLLGDNPSSSATTVPRPSKVRKMFAMRACRSSIMIGKALSGKQMGTVVRHMGEMEKPWNCPHGRPTMRHLCGLGQWDESGWREDGEGGTDWAAWLRRR